jgi:hypothetical protein
MALLRPEFRDFRGNSIAIAAEIAEFWAEKRHF